MDDRADQPGGRGFGDFPDEGPEDTLRTEYNPDRHEQDSTLVS